MFFQFIAVLVFWSLRLGRKAGEPCQSSTQGFLNFGAKFDRTAPACPQGAFSGRDRKRPKVSPLSRDRRKSPHEFGRQWHFIGFHQKQVSNNLAIFIHLFSCIPTHILPLVKLKYIYAILIYRTASVAEGKHDSLEMTIECLISQNPWDTDGEPSITIMYQVW